MSRKPPSCLSLISEGLNAEPFHVTVDECHRTAWGDPLRPEASVSARLAWQELQSSLLLAHHPPSEQQQQRLAFWSVRLLEDPSALERVLRDASHGKSLRVGMGAEACEAWLAEAPWLASLGEYSLGELLASMVEVRLWRAWHARHQQEEAEEAGGVRGMEEDRRALQALLFPQDHGGKRAEQGWGHVVLAMARAVREQAPTGRGGVEALRWLADCLAGGEETTPVSSVLQLAGRRQSHGTTRTQEEMALDRLLGLPLGQRGGGGGRAAVAHRVVQLLLEIRAESVRQSLLLALLLEEEGGGKSTASKQKKKNKKQRRKPQAAVKHEEEAGGGAAAKGPPSPVVTSNTQKDDDDDDDHRCSDREEAGGLTTLGQAGKEQAVVREEAAEGAEERPTAAVDSPSLPPPLPPPAGEDDATTPVLVAEDYDLLAQQLMCVIGR